MWTQAKEKRGWLIDGACVRAQRDERDSVRLSLSGLVESLHRPGNNEKGGATSQSFVEEELAGRA